MYLSVLDLWAKNQARLVVHNGVLAVFNVHRVHAV